MHGFVKLLGVMVPLYGLPLSMLVILAVFVNKFVRLRFVLDMGLPETYTIYAV